MDMYQVELTTDMDVVSIVVNASDENEAISIALTMFEQGEVDTAGSMLVNVAAFRACLILLYPAHLVKSKISRNVIMASTAHWNTSLNILSTIFTISANL